MLSGGKNQPFAMPVPNDWFWPVWERKILQKISCTERNV
jgi:hypothetical protein